MFQRTSLAGGPRVISACLPGSRALTAAAYVLTGSRSEGKAESGVAHFMEHLTFRGTAAFPTARAVSEAVEGVGGSSNAATDRETTVYWVRLPLREAALGLEMLGELVLRPQLTDADVEHERAVIIEEIRSYRDDASQHVYSVFDEAFFGDSPLGWEIAGTEASVAALSGETIRGFWGRAYRPSNVVVAVVGDLAHEQAVDLVDHAFRPAAASSPSPRPRPSPSQTSSPIPTPTQDPSAGPDLALAPAPERLPAGERLRVVEQDSAQAHLCLGLPALRRDHPDQWTLEMLDTILGDGSSSRLFQGLREEAGLAYDVHAFQVEYADCGVLEIYAGVAPERVTAATQAILGELAKLRDERVPAAELDRARAYVRGRLELRLEEGRHLVSWLGGQEALHEQVLTAAEAIERLESVDAEQIRTLAASLVQDAGLAAALVGPPGAAKGLEQVLHLP
ncbi:MAG TPA: pitrilysin family protein [Candidatus Limnocylindrales bacterium]|nr:pitrilysin family protein [Candidatus Limnocylindrales bacterium]